ncbi:hypothetical protein G9A89_013337 [Geosiphon pyriformis]|nr:hypothetical protein G9A89_013337 [Geosiphon pyriformis]
MELAILLISPAVQIIGNNLKINSVTGGSTTSWKREFTANQHQQHSRKEAKNLCKNNFKVVTTPDTTTLEYYQSIYTYCKQRFNIPDGIEVVRKSVYQYIENYINNYLFGNYNILEVRSNLYNNLVHYLQLGTKDLNSKTLATYFQELNFNIIKYCEETYPVQSQYSINFESETETSNKGKQKLKQYSKTTPNTPILPKTTAKYLQTPEQGTSSKLPLTITLFLALLAQAQTFNSLLNQFVRLKDFTSPRTANEENNSEISEKESIDSENEEDKMTAYIAKIPEFNGEDIETSSQEWLNQVTKAGDANGWNAARMLRTISYFLKRTTGKWFENLTTPFNDWSVFKTAFLEQFTDNNTSITFRNRFCNIKQELSKSDKLIKKICSHAPEDLNSAIQHAKRYEMAMEEANCTKLVNLAIEKTSSAAEKKIDQLAKKVENYFINQQQQQPQRYQPPKDGIKTTLYHPLITSLRVAITVEFLATGKKIAESYNETNKIGVINITLHHSNLIINYHQLTIHQDPNIKVTIISLPYSQFNSNTNNHPPNIINYLTIPEEPDFYHTVLSEEKAAARQQNPSYTPTTILPARIAENANLSDIFPFEFEANELLFLLSNAAANKQKAITAMYTEAKVEGKAIHLILDIIVTADGMKKTPVGEIDNFLFTLDRIIISVKVLVMDMPQYQALIRNDWLQKANNNTPEYLLLVVHSTNVPKKPRLLNSNWKKKSPLLKHLWHLGQPPIRLMKLNNMTTRWNVPYSKPEPRKQRPYISLKCKNCHKKLSSMGACISPEEEYENHTCYYCKTCHRE